MDPKVIFEHFRNIVTNHYFDMAGRVSRSDFWYFVLGCFVLGVGAAIIGGLTLLPLSAVVGLALLLPSAGMGARRLQDTGRDGVLVWALIIPSAITQIFALLVWGPFGIIGFLAFYFTIGWLLNLVALVALVALIYFWCQPGTPEANKYGPPPSSAVPVPAV
jgi:uncharacterized membrane protein YhaH (DUF805 family)